MGVAVRVQHGGMTDGIRKYAERTLQAGLRSTMRRPDAYKPRSATEAVGGTMRTRISQSLRSSSFGLAVKEGELHKIRRGN